MYTYIYTYKYIYMNVYFQAYLCVYVYETHTNTQLHISQSFSLSACSFALFFAFCSSFSLALHMCTNVCTCVHSKRDTHTFMCVVCLSLNVLQLQWERWRNRVGVGAAVENGAGHIRPSVTRACRGHDREDGGGPGVQPMRDKAHLQQVLQ